MPKPWSSASQRWRVSRARNSHPPAALHHDADFTGYSFDRVCALPYSVAVKISLIRSASTAFAFALLLAPSCRADITLLAIGTLDDSRGGSFTDLSGLNYKLENGAPANLLGGLGSAIAYASGNTFVALPDRGPNAIP